MLDLPTGLGATAPHRRRVVAAVVRELLTELERGETPATVARLAPDFVYRAWGAWPMWPYPRGPIDRAGFVDAARRIGAEFELVGSEIHELLIDGDTAAAHLTCAARNRGAGVAADFDLWMILRLRESLAVEAAVYVDAAKTARLLPPGLLETRSPAGAIGAAAGRTYEFSRPDDACAAADPEARHRGFLRQVALDLFILRARGDLEAMLGRLAPDFVYNPLGRWTRAPLTPGPCDRATFAETLRLVNIEFEDLGGEVHEILVDGDRVFAHRTIRVRNRGSGEIAHVDELLRFRVADGLVVEMASYVDSARIGGVDWPAYVAPR